jgi:guanylate kinase
MNTKNLFIVSGPSGSGQDSIVEGLAAILPIERVITSTTRKSRPGESDGKPYYFIDREEFERKLAEGRFIEWAKEYNDELYGVTREELERVAASGKVGIWKIEWKGVFTAKNLFPSIVAILISAPLESIEARLRKRDNPTEAYLAERMAYTREWMKYTDIYDYTVENKDGKLEDAVSRVAEIIRERTAEK